MNAQPPSDQKVFWTESGRARQFVNSLNGVNDFFFGMNYCLNEIGYFFEMSCCLNENGYSFEMNCCLNEID